LGGSNATKIAGTTASGGHSIYWNGFTNAYWVGINNAFSIYVKAAEYTKFQIADAGTGSFNATFDLTALTSAAIKGCTASITNEGGGWYRCGVVVATNAGVTPATRVTFGGYPSTGATNINYGPQYTGDGTSGVYIWGAQLELNSTVTSYQATNTIDVETNVVSAFRTLTETGSSADSQFNVFTTNQFLIESVTADNTENRTVVALRDITETGTSTDSQFNLVSFLSLINETGTATETETSQANFYPAVTENSGISAADSGTSKSTQYSNLIETTRKNIYANTDTFGSGWSVNNGTLTSTALTTDPFGDNRAYRLAEDTSNAIHREVYSSPHIAGTVYTLSVYIKADTRTKFVFFHEEGNSANRAGLTLDLTAGTKTNYTTGTGTVTSSTLSNAGNGWYRASFTFTATTNYAVVTHTFRLIDALGNLTYIGDGTSGLFLYGPQFEIGSLTAYRANNTFDAEINSLVTNQSTTENTGISATETEDRTVTATRDVTETGSANETEDRTVTATRDVTETGSANETEDRTLTATRDVTENTGISATESETLTISILNQLWEYTSKNLVKSPNDISGSYWSTQSTATVSTNVAVAPDGTQTADKLIGNNGNTTRKSVYYGGAYLTQNTTYTYSVYLKQAGFTNAAIWFDIPFANIGPNGYQGSGALINLIDGSTSGVTPTVTTVTSVGNGWYRCSVTGTTKLPWTFGVAGTIPANLQISLGDPNGVGTATGDGTSGIYVWGAQLELGSSATAFVDPNETVTQDRTLTATRDVTETGTANETETRVVLSTRTITETNTSSDDQTNTAIRLADLIESITATELTSAQAAFISAIQETLSAIDSGISNKITTSDIAEIVSALDSQNRFAFYVGDISELLNAVSLERSAEFAFITETGSLSTIELANILVNRGILETVDPTDSQFRQVITNSYITEISVAGESVVVWVFFPIDYELVTSRYSAGIEIQSDEIYMDNIDVFYADDDNIIASVFVEYDQIYIDDIDVLYGNIALIDDILDDEIYI
jgi:limonene-1,2-epoxide hydrolase